MIVELERLVVEVDKQKADTLYVKQGQTQNINLGNDKQIQTQEE